MPPVVLIMMDGVRPDALVAAHTPRIDALMANGAYTLNARSVMPSVTLPCHTSIFHSVPPSRHGITDNTWHPMARPVQGLVDAAHMEDKRCGFFHNWDELRDVTRPASLTISYCINSSNDLPDGDRKIIEAAVRYIPELKLDFAFVYIGCTDGAGHYYGWMEEGYIKQIEYSDPLVGMVLDALPPEATVILHADHGGHERGHGTDMPEDMTIPWIISGAGVKRGHIIQQPVSLLDTAPTIAHLLGIPRPRDWEGSVITEALL